MTPATTVLALLDHVETAHPVLAAAGLLAGRLLGARIDVLHIRPKIDPTFMPTEEVMTEPRAREFTRREDMQSADLKEVFDAWQRDAGGQLKATWREGIGTEKAVMSAEAGKGGLVVIGHQAQSHGGRVRDAIQASLFDAEAAVVLVPPMVPLTMGLHPAVAWKPSEAANRAVQAALPLLLAAERVTVLVADEDGSGDAMSPALQDVQRTLDSRFELRRVDPRGRRTSMALLEEAQAVGADLLVMGAYTRRRLIEFVLGGVTRDVLADVSLPVLMHH